MKLGLDGKVAVVTGASKGIGLAVTRRFVEEGARVIAGSRTVSADLSELVDGGAVESVTVDLAEPSGPANLVAAAGDRLDILVNNVGFAAPRLDSFLAITDDMWQHTLNLDFMAGVRAIRTPPGLPMLWLHNHILTRCGRYTHEHGGPRRFLA
jgi:NAD(P)-dependent dehydrogenase (short-subunit alcohol dehydrogenase family)